MVSLAIPGIFVLSAAILYTIFRHDMSSLSARLLAASDVVTTQYGEVDYATWGDGPIVLAVHGAGGGHDQGRLLAEAFGGDGFRWVAPSRFGYLRSPLPYHASTAAQAHAFARLLDHLRVERVAILAMSGGAPPALQFARLCPERTTALVLLASAPYAPFSAEEQDLPMPIRVYDLLFRSDAPFWAIKHVARTRLEALFDVRPELRAHMSAEERRFVDGLVDAFLPVTARVQGLGNEGAAIAPGAGIPLDEITAPTLVIHARDDRLAPSAVGEYTAAQIVGAEFLAFDDGGHLMIGHMAEIRARVGSFLRKNAGTKFTLPGVSED
jgi:pimeloyl-ACP methyl ester carboxylesterase